MESIGTSGEAGLVWVLGAVLGWSWDTMILEVGRIALAIQLVLYLPRMYRLGHKNETGRGHPVRV